eukprot:872398-Pelagomonas_calceolata.AAC.6
MPLRRSRCLCHSPHATQDRVPPTKYHPPNAPIMEQVPVPLTKRHHEGADACAAPLTDAHRRLRKHGQGGRAQQRAHNGSDAISAHRHELTRPPALGINEARNLQRQITCIEAAL